MKRLDRTPGRAIRQASGDAPSSAGTTIISPLKDDYYGSAADAAMSAAPPRPAPSPIAREFELLPPLLPFLRLLGGTGFGVRVGSVGEGVGAGVGGVGAGIGTGVGAGVGAGVISVHVSHT